jgi:predicted transport protein
MKKALVDVAGVRNVGKSCFDDIEIAVVKVKAFEHAETMTLQELEQTSALSIK